MASIIRTYRVQYHDPIVLTPGEVVKLGEEEQDEKWKGWIWAENKTHKGWVPLQVLDIAPDRQTARVLEFYSAREVDVDEGDTVEKITVLNGWAWVRNTRNNLEGWIPEEIIADEN